MPVNPKTFIIAEAGVNHNGSLKTALEMIDVAAKAGADAVKFQTFKAEKMISKYAPKAEYQKNTTGTEGSQLEMAKKFELGKAEHRELFDCCLEKKIQFISTPFDLESIDLLHDLGLQIFKIPSGEITNLPYLRRIGKLGRRVILSTGMARLGEIEDALLVLQEAGSSLSVITILHCNTAYPTPFDDVNLRAMLTIRAAFPGVEVGYSDHTQGIDIPIAAVAMGATVIEKHFTLDRTLPGPDHKASLVPKELHEMIQAIRHVEIALGDGVKKLTASEAKNKPIARKSIVAAGIIKKGEVFTAENLTVKRPGNGISPMRWDEVIGNVAEKDYEPDELI